LSNIPSYYFLAATPPLPSEVLVASEIDVGPTLTPTDFSAFSGPQEKVVQFLLSPISEISSSNPFYSQSNFTVSIPDVIEMNFSPIDQSSGALGAITYVNADVENDPSASNQHPILGETFTPGESTKGDFVGDVFVDRNVQLNQDLSLGGIGFWTLL